MGAPLEHYLALWNPILSGCVLVRDAGVAPPPGEETHAGAGRGPEGDSELNRRQSSRQSQLPVQTPQGKGEAREKGQGTERRPEEVQLVPWPHTWEVQHRTRAIRESQTKLQGRRTTQNSMWVKTQQFYLSMVLLSCYLWCEQMTLLTNVTGSAAVSRSVTMPASPPARHLRPWAFSRLTSSQEGEG